MARDGNSQGTDQIVEEARVARTMDGGDHWNTLTVAPHAWLSVRVFFHEEPMEGLEVTFHRATADGEEGPQIGAALVTDDSGTAALDYPVPAGNYVCRIESQPAIGISSVEDPESPCPLVLPIGRPGFDLEEQVDFEAEQE